VERDRMYDQRVVGLELTQVPAVFGLLRVDLYNNATSSCCELVEEGKLAKNLWGDVLRHDSTLATEVAPLPMLEPLYGGRNHTDRCLIVPVDIHHMSPRERTFGCSCGYG
jgi:hypothetical protein